MNQSKTKRCFLPLLLAVAATLSAVQSLRAAPFVYNSRDMMLCFRKTGSDGGTTGPYDWEVNIGQASTFYSATPGSTNSLGQFSTGQIAAVFDNLNDMSWSASGYAQSGDVYAPALTMWLTAPRSDPNVQSIPWIRGSTFNQQAPAQKVSSIGSGAQTYSGTISADPTFNTTTAVRIPAGNGRDYGTFAGVSGDLSMTFQGDIENTTPPDFVTGGVPSRCDLYEVRPSATNGPATYLGYVEIRTNGAAVFVAASTSFTPPAPSLTLTRNGNTNTISFVSYSGATYDLLLTNAAGLTASPSSWPTTLNVATGDGTLKQVTDVTSDPDRVYRVRAH